MHVDTDSRVCTLYMKIINTNFQLIYSIFDMNVQVCKISRLIANYHYISGNEIIFRDAFFELNNKMQAML